MKKNNSECEYEDFASFATRRISTLTKIFGHLKGIVSHNEIYREKSIPMTALWCPAFSNHG